MKQEPATHGKSTSDILGGDKAEAVQLFEGLGSALPIKIGDNSFAAMVYAKRPFLGKCNTLVDVKLSDADYMHATGKRATEASDILRALAGDSLRFNIDVAMERQSIEFVQAVNTLIRVVARAATDGKSSTVSGIGREYTKEAATKLFEAMLGRPLDDDFVADLCPQISDIHVLQEDLPEDNGPA